MSRLRNFVEGDHCMATVLTLAAMTMLYMFKKGQPPLRGASGRRCYLRRG